MLKGVTLFGIMKNPFAYGRVVEGTDYCPRPKIEKLLAGMLESGQNVVLHGERRVGKTSLAMRAARKRRTVYVDFLACNDAGDVTERIVKAALKAANDAGFLDTALKAFASLRPKVTIDPDNGSIGATLDTHASELTIDSIEAALEKLGELHKKKAIVVILDEFQDVLRIKDERVALARMRSVIQFQGDLPYVFSGSSRDKMEMIFSDPDSPFFKSAITIEVGAHAGLSFRNFLKRKFEKTNRKVGAGLFEAIDGLGVNVTGDVQQLCWALWLLSERGGTVGVDSVDEALDMIFQIERSKYEDAVLNVSATQLKVLVALAVHGGKGVYSADFKRSSGVSVVGTITKAIQRLEALRIVYRHRNEIRFANPFFGIWVRTRFA